MPIAPVDPRTSAVLLDVDGTVLDLAPTPGAVRASSALKDVLQQVYRRTGGALAFVSGRPIADLDVIFSPLAFPAVGGHGAELRLPDGSRHLTSRELDATLRRRLRTLAHLRAGVLVEDKGYSVAVHYRLAPEAADWVRERVGAICGAVAGRLVVLPGKCVVEVKRADYDKGSGVRALMTHAPFSSRRPVFIGDDVTDEPAFAALAEFGGVGFSVGRAIAGASRRFEGPEDVRDWLSRVALFEEHAR